MGETLGNHWRLLKAGELISKKVAQARTWYLQRRDG